MAVINNLNTRQTPITTGKTGTQVIKFINAPRVYIKAVDSTPTPVVVKSNGTTPSGYTDLGIVNDQVAITYSKDINEVRTGIDEVLRATYVRRKTAGFEFQLSQFDDVVMEQVSGLTASQIVNGSIYQFALGSEEVIQRALLMVVQDKLTGKEWQFYHPNAFLSFTISDSNGETILTGKGDLPMFAWGGGSSEAIMVPSIFS